MQKKKLLSNAIKMKICEKRKSQYRKYKHWFKKLWKDRKTYVNGEKQKNLRLNDHSILQKRWIQHYIKSSSRLIPLLINKLEFFIFKMIFQKSLLRKKVKVAEKIITHTSTLFEMQCWKSRRREKLRVFSRTML